MNTLVKLITTFIILILSNLVKANDNPLALSNESTLLNYIETVQQGNPNLKNSIFSNDFKQIIRMENGNKEISKMALLKHFKSIENITLNCNISYKVIDSTQQITIAKVSFQFENFIRVDYVILAKTKSNLWEIKEINTTYNIS